MPSVNFKARFASQVQRRDKLCTIRKKRKRPIKEGDTLYFFTGMRTKQCRRLGTAKCLLVVEVTIDESVVLGGCNLCIHSADRLACFDGFVHWEEMRDFFDAQYGLPFTGDWIVWGKEAVRWFEYVKRQSSARQTDVDTRDD
jgi:hypothetical protein